MKVDLEERVSRPFARFCSKIDFAASSISVVGWKSAGETLEKYSIKFSLSIVGLWLALQTVKKDDISSSHTMRKGVKRLIEEEFEK